MKITIKMGWWLLCLCHSISYCQLGKISGNIQFPAASESVLVQLLSAKDNSIMKTVIPEADGTFEFSDLVYEGYIVAIDDEKFVPFHSEVININANAAVVSLPTIVLVQPAANQLTEVVATEKNTVSGEQTRQDYSQC